MIAKLYTAKITYIVLLLGIAVTAVYVWLRPGYLIGYGDEYWFIDPSVFIKDFFYLWNTRFYSGGWFNYSIPQVFPITFFWFALKLFGFSLYSIQFVWFTLINFLPGLSIFFLINFLLESVYKKSKYIYFCSFVGALVYSYNLVLVQLLPTQPHLKPVMIGAPLLLLFTIKGLQAGNKRLFSTLIALSTLIFAQSNVNFAYTTPIFAFILLFTLYHCVLDPRSVKHSLVFLFETYGLILLVNLWWVVPLVVSRTHSGSEIETVLGNWNAVGGRPILDYFRLLGFWGWEQGTKTYDYYPYHNVYNTLPLFVITYGVTVCALIGIVVKPNKYSKSMLILFVLGIFLTKGNSGVFGSVFIFMFKHVPFFWIFRDPFSKFAIYLMFPVSILFSFFVHSMLSLKTKYRYLVYIVPIFLLLSAFPIFKGMFLVSQNSVGRRSNYVKVPDYWSNYVREENSSVMVGLPAPYGSEYSWESGFNGDPFVMFTQKDLYKFDSMPITLGGKLLSSGYTALILHKDTLIKTFIDVFPIEKIVIPNDLIADKFLNQQVRELFSTIYKKETQGVLESYSVQDPLPKIYVTEKLITASGDFLKNWRVGLSLFSNVQRPTFFTQALSNQPIFAEFENNYYISVDVVDKQDKAKIPNVKNATLYQFSITDAVKRDLTLKINAESGLDFTVRILNAEGKVLFVKDFSVSQGHVWHDLQTLSLPQGKYYLVLMPIIERETYMWDTKKPSSKVNIGDFVQDTNSITFSATNIHNYLLYEIPGFNSNKHYAMTLDYTLLNGSLEFFLVQNDAVYPLYRCEPPAYSVLVCDGNVFLPIDPYIYSNKAYIGLSLSDVYDKPEIGSIKVRSLSVKEVLQPNFALVAKEDVSNVYRAVDYTQISPTQYKATLTKDLPASFVVVFANNFNSGWRLKTGGKYISQAKHVLINGYANGWLLNRSDLTDDDIEIVFVYQKYFEVGVIISLGSIVLSLIYIYINFGKKQRDFL